MEPTKKNSKDLESTNSDGSLYSIMSLLEREYSRSYWCVRVSCSGTMSHSNCFVVLFSICVCRTSHFDTYFPL